jgi:hypothetical protein
MTRSLSFRKESILRSSSASETIARSQEAHGSRPAHEQRPISLTTIFNPHQS